MTQPQARVVKPRSRTRLIPPSSRTRGPTPASRMSQIRATLAQLLSKLRTAVECRSAFVYLRFVSAIFLVNQSASNQRGARSQLLDLISGGLELGLRARLRPDIEAPRRPDKFYQVDYTFRMAGSLWATQESLVGSTGRPGGVVIPHPEDGTVLSTATCNGCAIRPSISDSRFRGRPSKSARTPPPRATISKAVVTIEELRSASRL